MNKSKTISIIVIIIGVVVLAIGFSAFSSTLTISSSANVNPSSSAFSVVLSTKADSTSSTFGSDNYEINKATDLTAEQKSAISVSGTTISGLTANFTAPNQTITYTFYARNVGQYIAYLNNMTLGDKTCTPGTGATASLVTAACEAIDLVVSITNSNGEIAAAMSSNNTNYIQTNTLNIDDYEKIRIQIAYTSDVRADGPFTVSFGNINLLYESTTITN